MRFSRQWVSRFGMRNVRRIRRTSSGTPLGSGQSVVEFALLSPLVLLILLGTIDLGRMYSDYASLRQGAREGAGYGIVKPSDTAGITAAVLDSGVPAGTTSTSSCSGNCTTIDGTGQVIVTAQSTFNPVTIGFFSWLGADGSITLSATAKMRVLT